MLRVNISVLHFSLSVHILVSDPSMGLIWANVNKHLKNYSIWKLNLQKTKQSPILYTRKRNRTRTEQVGYGIISFVKPYIFNTFREMGARGKFHASAIYILAHVLVLFIDLDATLLFTVLCLFTTDTTLDWGNSMTFSFRSCAPHIATFARGRALYRLLTAGGRENLTTSYHPLPFTSVIRTWARQTRKVYYSG